MEFKYNDGGRSKYFTAKNVGDCVTRAIANATGLDYKLVYDSLRKSAGGSVRNGCPKKAYTKVMGEIGLIWKPTMTIGSGCNVHLSDGELPRKGRLVVRVSRHLTCLKDGVLYDTYDCTRDGDRCVYGYWYVPKCWDMAQAEANLRALLSKKRRSR